MLSCIGRTIFNIVISDYYYLFRVFVLSCFRDKKIFFVIKNI